MMYIILIAIIISFTFYIYKFKKLKDRKRVQHKVLIETLYPTITRQNSEWFKLIQIEQGYFNNRKLELWHLKTQPIINQISDINLDKLNLDTIMLSEAKKLQEKYINRESLRKQFNNAFIEHQLTKCENLFNNIDNASLDLQQRIAIIKDEDHNLVIAGAGSGKTTTVAGKVAYLINHGNINPDEILLITFTRKASDEMRERIREKMGINVEVNTFHSLGRKIIGQVTNNLPSVIEEKQFYEQLKVISKTLMTNSNYANQVIQFLTQYRLEVIDPDDFNSHGEYINYLKENNVKSYKTVERNIGGRVTILREICKSLEEVKIANFLFVNNIEYRYEASYEHPTADNQYAQYKPDFYLPDHGIYIEHFGLIDEENNVPHWFSKGDFISAKEKYNSDIAWKRMTHIEHQTILIETYSYENKKGILLENLQSKLEKLGVKFNPKSADEVWNILNSVANEDVTAFDTLINTFLNLFKSNNFEINKLRTNIKKNYEGQIKSRLSLFLTIFEPILNEYNAHLKKENLIDFSDMINQSAQYCKENKFSNKYQYIIVDEFQDTSVGRYDLIKTLLENNNTCKLFAVGDDWQSIYRFAGSDIALFTEFEKYFGTTEISKIETTYRFKKKMIAISSAFILANPNQTSKQLKSFSDSDKEPLEIIYGDSFKNDDPIPIIEVLEKIDADCKGNEKKPTIMALSRYKHFIQLFKERKDLFTVKYNVTDQIYSITYLQLPHLTFDFITVHRSKGLQADYVILVNCVSGQYGFPAEQADDPIMNLLLSKADQFKNGEERRLFYVALTRAKIKTFITTNKTYKSKFLKEIDPNDSVDSKSKCPVCKDGDKVIFEGINRNGNPFVRYTCSNWMYDCDYLEWEN